MIIHDHFSHALRSMSTSPPPNTEYLVPVYLFLLITGGHVLLPIIIATALVHKKLSWHPTLINLCITWVLFSVIHCLYLYAGGDRYDGYGYRTICLVQAAMLYGSSPMAIVAGLCVVIHAWTTIQPCERSFDEKFPRWLCRFLIISPPYIVFAGFSIGAGILINQHQDVANPSNGLFCKIHVEYLTLPVPVFCAVVMILVLCFEVAITIRYYQRWKRIKNSFPLMARRPSTSLVFRVGLFCLYSWTALVHSVFDQAATGRGSPSSRSPPLGLSARLWTAEGHAPRMVSWCI
ncbi:hypothetical protein K503DRAFT_242581 [Rhizopogon vinicolor AM-OR11-026]|uniref:Fungal pheromone STE3G-protein-coupled receptor n=1 Tax=Rhizopogon vinicolor AM-OR11-026 TaxID=1314800 RepID=A0A1B7NE55_9AGAM|nr:hypothetical protein K503DRAFT_242581 [Rhizopogon vinicolor AM-OR11-026]